MDKTELRQKKSQLSEEKKNILEQNRSISNEMKKIRSEANQLKKERDELNKLVQESKVERKKASTEMKKVAPPNVDMNVYKGLDRTEELGKQLEKLEWTYQTSSLSPQKDKEMSKKISELTALYKIAKERDSLTSEVRNKRGKSDIVKKEHKAFHLNVLRYAEDSEKKHKTLMGKYKKLDDLKKKKMEISKRLDDIRDEIEAVNGKLFTKEERDAMERRKEAAKRAQSEMKQIADKYQVVKQKLDKGGVLTKDDLMVLQRYDQYNEQTKA